MHSVCLSVRLSLQALIVVSIHQMSFNLYVLFISDTERTVLKMICTKVLRFILAYRGMKILKFIVSYLYTMKCVTIFQTKYNEIKYFIQLYKSMFRIQYHTKDFLCIMSYTWKLLDMYAFHGIIVFHGLFPSY